MGKKKWKKKFISHTKYKTSHNILPIKVKFSHTEIELKFLKKIGRRLAGLIYLLKKSMLFVNISKK